MEIIEGGVFQGQRKKTLNGKIEAQRMITNNIRTATDKQRFTVV